MNGQTPGKRLLGMRVVSVQGHPINGVQAVMRNILRGVDMMPLVPLSVMDEELGWFAMPTFAVGLLCQTFSPRFQRVGDVACGTMVVMDERRRRPIASTHPGFLAALIERIPVSFVTDRQTHRAISTYVDRRNRISTARRRDIAKHLALPLVKRFGLPPETDYDLLLCALNWRESPRGLPRPTAKQDESPDLDGTQGARR
jgi:hypothetical protein